MFPTHSPEKWENPPSLQCQQPVQAQQGGSRGWMLPLSQAEHHTAPSYSPHPQGHTKEQNTADLQLLVGSGFRT